MKRSTLVAKESNTTLQQMLNREGIKQTNYIYLNPAQLVNKIDEKNQLINQQKLVQLNLKKHARFIANQKKRWPKCTRL